MVEKIPPTILSKHIKDTLASNNKEVSRSEFSES